MNFDIMSMAPALATGILSSGGVGAAAITFFNARLSRRDHERDKEQNERQAQRDRLEEARKREEEAQARRVGELHAKVVKLETQVDSMGVEYPHPEWKKDPYTHAIIDCNAAFRRKFFLPYGIVDPIGKTFADCGFLPEALDLIEQADRDAMQSGFGIAICRPTANVEPTAFIKMIGETRGLKRSVVCGFAIPASIAFAGEIGTLINAMQAQLAERMIAARAARAAEELKKQAA